MFYRKPPSLSNKYIQLREIRSLEYFSLLQFVLLTRHAIKQALTFLLFKFLRKKRKLRQRLRHSQLAHEVLSICKTGFITKYFKRRVFIVLTVYTTELSMSSGMLFLCNQPPHDFAIINFTSRLNTLKCKGYCLKIVTNDFFCSQTRKMH